MVSSADVFAAEHELFRNLSTLNMQQSIHAATSFFRRTPHDTPPYDIAYAIFHVLLQGPTHDPERVNTAQFYIFWSQIPLSSRAFKVGSILLFGDTLNAYKPSKLKTYCAPGHHLTLLQRKLPNTLPSLLGHYLQRISPPNLNTLHSWLCEQPGDWSDVHLHILRSSKRSAPVDRRAILHLTAPRSPQQDTLRKLLAEHAAGKAALRRLACTGYTRLSDVNALQTMLDKEKSTKLKEDLQDALRTLHKPSMHNVRERFGIYTIGDPIDERDALETLRTLFNREPTTTGWYRICNLLERLRISEQSTMALSYAREALTSWDAIYRPCPHHWSASPEFSALASHNPDDAYAWLPIETLAHQSEHTRISLTLQEAQKNSTSTPITLQHTRQFVRYTQHAWSWCATHQIHPEMIRMRLDAGSFVSNDHTMSALSIEHAFGVLINPFARPRMDSKHRPRGLSVAHVALDRDHPARDTLMMEKRKTNFDIPGF